MTALSGCVSRHGENPTPLPPPVKASVISLQDYALPFGEAPAQPDLKKVFFSLPDALVSDMPMKSRQLFLDQASVDMFDPAHNYLSFFSDNPYSPIQASSIFSLKILPSSHYAYIVLIHMVKPSALNQSPSPANTFLLAPVNGKWIDVTTQLLPPTVNREWEFEPNRTNDVVAAGPYEQGPYGWTSGAKKMHLVWKNDRLIVKAEAADQ